MAAKPNIIVFMTDHQRGDTIQAGSPVKTPNLDRFRKQAVNFTRAYCPAPHCCPSRATFFSGLYPTEHGVWNNVNVSNTFSRGLYEGTRLFSQDLKEAGYRLYFSGKWHVSVEKGPEDFGFETLYHPYTYQKSPRRPDTREWHWYDGKNEMDTGEEERTEGRILRPGYPPYIQYGIDESPFDDVEVTQAAADYLAQMEDKDSPFFLYVGPLGPHDPYFVPQRFLDLYPIEDIRLPDNFADSMDDKPAMYRRTQDRYSQLTPEEHRECIRRFYAFCSYEDYLFGKVLEQVEKRGIMENTLILYVSDHGDYMGSHGLWAKGLPGSLPGVRHGRRRSGKVSRTGRNRPSFPGRLVSHLFGAGRAAAPEHLGPVAGALPPPGKGGKLADGVLFPDQRQRGLRHPAGGVES